MLSGDDTNGYLIIEALDPTWLKYIKLVDSSVAAVWSTKLKPCHLINEKGLLVRCFLSLCAVFSVRECDSAIIMQNSSKVFDK